MWDFLPIATACTSLSQKMEYGLCTLNSAEKLGCNKIYLDVVVQNIPRSMQRG